MKFNLVSKGDPAEVPAEVVAPAVSSASTTVGVKAKGSKEEILQSVKNEFLTLEGIEAAAPGVVPTVLRVGLGATVNIGNFQSVRVDVSIETPTTATGAELAYDVCRYWVEGRIKAEILKAKKLVPGKDEF